MYRLRRPLPLHLRDLLTLQKHVGVTLFALVKYPVLTEKFSKSYHKPILEYTIVMHTLFQ